MALLLGVSLGHGQPVPDAILLPDSLGPLRPPYHLAFGSSTSNIYVASESSDVMVVDGETFQRIKRINTGTPVRSALLVRQHNRLYCSYPEQGRIGVIDCATNTVVGSIQVGTRPTLLCYSSGSDKLYCGDTVDRTVSVINCATNAVLKVIPVGESLTVMAHDPTTGKIYAATRDAVLAISCAADSIVASIDAIVSSRGLCVNKRRQKLYVVGRRGTAPDTVYAVSTKSDSVAARIPTFGILAPVLACNEVTDRAYGGTEYGGAYVLEFDCIQDTLVRDRFVGADFTTVSLFCDSVRNRLYHWFEYSAGYLLVMDCATLDFISLTAVHQYPGILESDPARYRIMCAGGSSEDGSLTVFDYKGDSSYARGAVPLCGWRQVMCHNPATGKLYCGWGGAVGGVGVIDQQTNRLVTQVFLPQGCGDNELVHSPTSNKVYFDALNAGGLGVLDGSGDSLLKAIQMEHLFTGLRPCWCPEGNKVYCFARRGDRWYIAVVDCYTDSVVREMDVYDLVLGFEYLGERRMLCSQYEHLTLIDTWTDSVLVDSALERSVYYAAAHTGDGEKVYIVRNGRLQVRSSSSLSLLATIDWAYGELGGGLLVYSDTTRKLYWFDQRDSVLAIDATSDTVVARMSAYGVNSKQLCIDHSGRYLFCAGYLDNRLRVYDMQADSQVSAYVELPSPPFCITPNPDQGCIYVGCQDAILVCPDVPPGVGEAMNDERGVMSIGASIVRGVLLLAESPGTSCLMDVSGRKVMGLKSGANDVRALAPGVYFVREAQAQAQAQAVRKVVLTE